MKLFKTKKEKMFEKMSFHSYSQDGEDMIIRSFFEEKYEYKGFYVDVGAYHPYRFSNTMHFYNTGWTGINIEAAPDSADLFKKYRSRDINLNVGIADAEDEMIFYCFNEPALNSFSKELSMERNNKNGYFITAEIPIKVYPLKEVLSKHLPVGQKIDFMSIDCEGLDLQVLKSNDWQKFSPTYLLVEAISDNLEDVISDPIYRYVSALNYKLIAKTLRTLIFKKVA